VCLPRGARRRTGVRKHVSCFVMLTPLSSLEDRKRGEASPQARFFAESTPSTVLRKALEQSERLRMTVPVDQTGKIMPQTVAFLT